MFTVKHLAASGTEIVFEAAGSAVFRDGILHFDGPGGSTHSLTEGRVFVMNAAGKTVADYRLGGAENPRPGRGEDMATDDAIRREREADASFAEHERRAGRAIADRPARDERLSDDVKRETAAEDPAT